MPRSGFSDATESQAVASSARTVDGNAATVAAGSSGINGVTVHINVTAVGGTTPSVTFQIQESLDGGTTWALLAASSPVTATGMVPLRYIGPHGQHIRLAWLITGTTPSFTFSHKMVSY